MPAPAADFRCSLGGQVRQRHGWPSFIRAIPGTIGTRADNSLFAARTEVHCRRCGGHLGHVFDDGPRPTGQRWCMNGVAMRFVPGRA
jgi:peptide-methionine (R)-S-oxide reductase